jgi:hypothetical protein
MTMCTTGPDNVGKVPPPTLGAGWPTVGMLPTGHIPRGGSTGSSTTDGGLALFPMSSLCSARSVAA